MKKILLFSIMITLIFAASSLVYAAAVTDGGCGDSYSFSSDNTWAASKNVTLCLNGAAQSYAAITKHLNGNRTFGTASNTSKIYWNDSGVYGTTGTALSTAPSASDSSEFGSGWSEL